MKALVPDKKTGDVSRAAIRQDDLLSEIGNLVAGIGAKMADTEPSWNQ